MAQLETDCCTPVAHASCCEPEQKAQCCGEHAGAGCGCAPITARLEDVEIHKTDRVHEHAGAAIIRARKPAPAG